MKLGSAARRGIVTGGTWCADHNKFVSHWPGEEEVVEIRTLEVRGGGSACNLAIDMKRLDADIPVSTIGLIGDDEDGRILIAEADAAGIDRTGLAIAETGDTSYTDAFNSAKSGRRTHLYLPGTAADLSPDHFDFTEISARILHLGLPSVSMHVLRRSVEIAGPTRPSFFVVGSGRRPLYHVPHHTAFFCSAAKKSGPSRAHSEIRRRSDRSADSLDFRCLLSKVRFLRFSAAFELMSQFQISTTNDPKLLSAN